MPPVQATVLRSFGTSRPDGESGHFRVTPIRSDRWCLARTAAAITSSNEKTAILWDTETGQQIRIFSGYSEPILYVAMSRDGRHLLINSARMLTLWNAETGHRIREFSGGGAVLGPDDRCVVTSTFDSTKPTHIFFWDAESGRQIRSLDARTQYIPAVALSPDGRRLATGSWEETVTILDVESGRPVHVLAATPSGWNQWRSAVTAAGFWSAHGMGPQSFGIPPPDKGLARWMGAAVMWPRWHSAPTAAKSSPAPGRYGHPLERHHRDAIRDFHDSGRAIDEVAFSPDGQKIITSSNYEPMIIWDAATGQKVRSIGDSGQHSGAMSPDGRLVLTSKWDKLILWDAATGQQVRSFGENKGLIWLVAFSPDGRRIVTGSSDKTAKLWDTDTGQEIRSLNGHGDSVCSVVFSPDGRFVLTGSWDRKAILWDAVTGQEVRSFRGHTNWVHSVAFSPDGDQVLTG